MIAALIAAIIYSFFAAGFLPDTLAAHWSVVWSGAIDAATPPHPIWGRIIAFFGLGHEAWASIIPAAFTVGAAVKFVWLFGEVLRPDIRDQLDRGYNIRWGAAAVTAFTLALGAAPVFRAATEIDFLALDFALVVAAVGALLRLRSFIFRFYSIPRLVVLALAVTGLILERPHPFALLQQAIAFAISVVAGIFLAWVLATVGELRDVEMRKRRAVHGGVETYAAPPITMIGILIVGALVVGSPIYTAIERFHAPRRIADLAAELTLADAKDADLIVADSFLGDALARKIAMRGLAKPRLVHLGFPYDEKYLASLKAKVASFEEERTLSADERMSLDPAVELSAPALAEELSLLALPTGAVAKAWSKELWPESREFEVWKTVAPLAAGSEATGSRYFRRALARIMLETAAEHQAKAELEAAAKIYLYVWKNIDPDNISVLFNLYGMRRRGYPFGEHTIAMIDAAYRAFASDRARTTRVERLVREGGRVFLSEDEIVVANERFKPQLESIIRLRNQAKVEENRRYAEELRGVLDSGDVESLGKAAKGILRRDRTNALANGLLGTLEAGKANYAEAEFYLARAAREEAAPIAVLNNYAETLRTLGKFEEAEIYARKAVAAGPKFWRVHETLADVLYSKGADPAMVRAAMEPAFALLAEKGEKPTAETATLFIVKLGVLEEEKRDEEAAALKAALFALPLSDRQRARLVTL